MKRLIVAFVVLPLLVLVPDEVRASDKKEIRRLQIQVHALQGQLADMQRLTQESQSEIRRLTEIMAEQTSQFRSAMREQQMQGEAIQSALRETATRLAELAERFQALELAQRGLIPPPPGGPTGGDPTAAGASTAPPPPPRELYSQAYADYARGNFDLAIQGFGEYLRHYPETDFSDNAQYWVGECHYGKQRYMEAIESWNKLLRDFSSSDKLPDARVKKGMALERLGRRSQALLEYRYVVERYPNAPAARIARDKLNPQ